MPVVEWEPKNLKGAAVVAYSDARDSFEAIKEIDAWALEHGLVRARENWLAPVLRHNQRLFRGACYPAPGLDEITYPQELLKEAERRRASMPKTTSSEQLQEDCS